MVKLPQRKSTIKDSYTGSSTKNAQFYDPPPPIIHKKFKNEKQICFLKPIESKNTWQISRPSLPYKLTS